jgi:hypothetical protein
VHHFARSSTPALLWSLRSRPDVIIVDAPAIFCAPAAWLYRFVRFYARTLGPYLTHTINIHLKTTSYVIKNIRVALPLEK